MTTTEEAESTITIVEETKQQTVVEETTKEVTMIEEQVITPVITRVQTETIGGAVAVALSPKELTRQERRRMRKRRGVQVHMFTFRNMPPDFG